MGLYNALNDFARQEVVFKVIEQIDTNLLNRVPEGLICFDGRRFYDSGNILPPFQDLTFFGEGEGRNFEYQHDDRQTKREGEWPEIPYFVTRVTFETWEVRSRGGKAVKENIKTERIEIDRRPINRP